MGHAARLNNIDSKVHALLERGAREEALVVLMDGYGTSLYRFCYGLLRCRFLADDVLQTTFVQAYEDLGSISCQSFRPWLFKIACHRCLDALKAQRRWEERFLLQGEPPESPDEGASSEDRLIAGSLVALLEECLGELEEAERTAISLRYQDGFTYPEMARICHEQPATLQARISRALPKLRQCLARKGVIR